MSGRKKKYNKDISHIWILLFLLLLTLLLSAMLYGRGRKVLTLWGGRERSSSDSGVRPDRPDRPADPSLSSWPVLVLLALDNRRELKGRRPKQHEPADKEAKPFHRYLCRTVFLLEKPSAGSSSTHFSS